MTNEQIQEWVEQYCLGNMDSTQRQHFEDTLAESNELRKIYNEHLAFMRLLEHRTAKAIVGNQLNIIRKEQHNTLHQIGTVLKVHINKYWRNATVAAGVALIASTITFMVARNNYENKLNNKVLALVRPIKNDISKIKIKQHAIDKQMADQLPEQPNGSSKEAGTCFAINNNGYAITNAHVVGNSNSIYIFTNDGIGHKATIVHSDKELDIAILKINEINFKFTAQGLPYTLSNSSSSMAQDVYTIGYPKNSLVYSKGYISSETGFEDDSSRYQMELPSSPGVSGSPVFDEQGNVIAMINSKEPMHLKAVRLISISVA
jgi:serine protease Do